MTVLLILGNVAPRVQIRANLHTRIDHTVHTEAVQVQNKRQTH